MAKDACAIVAQCIGCAGNQSQYKNKLLLQLYSSCGRLVFVAMDIRGPLSRNAQDNETEMLMTDRYSMLTRAVPILMTSATQAANIFLDEGISPFCIPSYVLTDNNSQFVNKFFKTMCRYLGVKHLTKATYHRQTNAQIDRYNKTIVKRLSHYISDHHRNRDVFFQPLTNSYNIQVHRSAKRSSYNLALIRLPPGPSLLLADSERLRLQKTGSLRTTKARHDLSPHLCAT